ncbi:glycosyltransferase [Arthrobacter alpinus]|nr:glycosyltransferase [Arthrobacter alpinus]
MIARTVAELRKTVDFTVIHHVTFAVDWMPCGLHSASTEIPTVWGPVGGSTYVPASMFRWLGFRGTTHELARAGTTKVLRRMFGDPMARSASLTVALNDDVRRRFASRSDVVVEANAVIDIVHDRTCGAPAEPGTRGSKAVFVGRLVAWKGIRLALDSLKHPGAENWTLDFIGSGSERDWLEREVVRRGLKHRVLISGQMPRLDVLAAMQKADALVFPSLHDSAGWVVAEAAAVGLPVICLDIGGPPELAGPNGHVVACDGNAAAEIARELSFLESAQRPQPSNRWSADRLPDYVDGWYERAEANWRVDHGIAESVGSDALNVIARAHIGGKLRD